MEHYIQSSCPTKNSEVRSGGTIPWTNKDMFGESDLTWDAEREVNVLACQLNFALRAIEEKEVNVLKWQLELLLSAGDVD